MYIICLSDIKSQKESKKRLSVTISISDLEQVMRLFLLTGLLMTDRLL